MALSYQAQDFTDLVVLSMTRPLSLVMQRQVFQLQSQINRNRFNVTLEKPVKSSGILKKRMLKIK